MLHHIEIYVSEIEQSFSFWSELLERIGYTAEARWQDGFTLQQGNGTYLTFVQVAERHAHRPYHRSGIGLNHLAFRVPTRAGVDDLRAYCLEKEITCLYDERYPFPNGGTDYYALFIEDPDRIKVEFVADHENAG